MCKRDWERQKGEGARVSANECVSELATRAAGRRRGCRCGCRLRLTKVLGVGSSDLAWFGLGGTDNQGEEGKEGEEGRSCLLHLHLQVHLQSKCKCKYSYGTEVKTTGEGG